MAEAAAEPDPVLAEKVSCEGGYKPFGEMTLADVVSRAGELRAAAGVPAMAQRMAAVAGAWRALAEQMERDGAAIVAEIDQDGIAKRAERLRIVPPGGGLLR